ncbi:MAG TPA: hypothetical protein VNB22_17450 [Pyrinomonadaceae bacterium]|nr:hypothetical protein [Pyrinomonadaceae bacterium]
MLRCLNNTIKLRSISALCRIRDYLSSESASLSESDESFGFSVVVVGALPLTVKVPDFLSISLPD